MANKLKIARIEKKTVENRATDALRQSIITRAIPPGSRITETQLAEQMNLSRATVRAALHQLAEEGLTKLVPYTGWSVISLSPHDVWELYTLRSAIERLAAQLAAGSLSREKSAHLNGAWRALVASCKRGDEAAIAEADFLLHHTIVDMAEHTRLAAQYKLIEHQTRVYIRSSDALVAGPDDIIAQHKPIVDAILAGDAAEAGRLSEIHNITEGEKLSGELSHAATMEKRNTAARALGTRK
ncbi:MAG: GntR family transcriptional regulator [Candidimonas sp.]|nr:MAG: GntR family transcriptional regulator [Candidimonas sp.]